MLSFPQPLYDSILELAVPEVQGLALNGVTIANVRDLLFAHAALCEHVKVLNTHPLIRLAAESVADGATVIVDGGLLFVDTGASESRTTAPTTRKSRNEPSLDSLREQAEALGVDISDLGRKKGLIIARLAKQTEAQSAEDCAELLI